MSFVNSFIANDWANVVSQLSFIQFHCQPPTEQNLDSFFDCQNDALRDIFGFENRVLKVFFFFLG